MKPVLFGFKDAGKFICSLSYEKMKLLLKKIVVLILLIIILFIGLSFYAFHFVFPQYSQGYDAALMDKMERLESIKEPKIILVGSSNLAFGMNSEKLEDVFQMPVVNMGLHGALGNSFEEKELIGNVNSGDIVVICHHDYSTDNSIENTEIAWITIENHYDLWYLVGDNWWEMMKAFPNYMLNSIWLYMHDEGNRSIEGSYSRNSFNKWGDISTIREHKDFALDPDSSLQVSTATALRLNKLNQYIESKNASMVIAAYPIVMNNLASDKERYHMFQQNLENNMDCAVISEFEDYIMDDKYFFDTPLHLTSEGAEIRTEKLILDLSNWKSKKEY